MMRFLFLIVLCLVSLPAQASQDLNYKHFAAIPIQHEGRIKPIDTFARASLKKFSGSDSINGTGATPWLAQTLFDPAAALAMPLFRIFKPELLDLPQRKARLYSFTELTAALRAKGNVIEKLAATDPKNWSEDQQEIMRLQESSILYAQMLRSFSLILPLNLEVPKTLAEDWKIDATRPMTLRELSPHEKDLKARAAAIYKHKGENTDRYSDEEKAIIAFAFNADVLRQGGESNILLRVVPKQEEWLSPWNSDERESLGSWEETAKAYLTGDNEKFVESTQALAREAKGFRTSLELSYNAYHPLGMASVLYLLAFLLFAAQSVWNKRGLAKASLFALGIAALLNMFAIASRVIILSRPPVGTLYESILFVAALCAVVALFMELKRKDGSGLLAGSLSGMLLLFVAQGFAAEDTMQMLVAVLNTNFWLATHVLCITTGYAICLLTSFFAHLYLFKAGRGTDASSTRGAMRILGLVALLFTTIGTILGGIWADQSWGRFWGWDPKENGALLIVLWIVWIYHGQLSGHIRGFAFAAGLAALSIIVALAWFGVNLLNVGLHSYGFITGVAASLAAFCVLEAILIGGLWWKARQYERRDT